MGHYFIYIKNGKIFTILNSVYSYDYLRINYQYNSETPSKVGITNTIDTIKIFPGWITTILILIIVGIIIGIVTGFIPLPFGKNNDIAEI